jgi:hypothetical protein
LNNIYFLSIFFLSIVFSSCTTFEISQNKYRESSNKSTLVANDEEVDAIIAECHRSFVENSIDYDINTFVNIDISNNETRALGLWAYDPNEEEFGNGEALKYLYFAYLQSADKNDSPHSIGIMRTFDVYIVAIMEFFEEEQYKSLDEPPKFTRILLNSGFHQNGMPDKLWHVFYNASKMELKELHTILSEGFKKSGG